MEDTELNSTHKKTITEYSVKKMRGLFVGNFIYGKIAVELLLIIVIRNLECSKTPMITNLLSLLH